MGAFQKRLYTLVSEKKAKLRSVEAQLEVWKTVLCAKFEQGNCRVRGQIQSTGVLGKLCILPVVTVPSWLLLRRRMNNELNFPPNFERLVLGCIDADFCK